MKVSISDLKGRALDYAVAMFLGHNPVKDMQSHGRCWRGWWERTPVTAPTLEYRDLQRYSSSIVHAWPIIDRFDITIGNCYQWNSTQKEVGDYVHKAEMEMLDGKPIPYSLSYGPTKIVAAMRCFVKAMVGEDQHEVEVPDELVEPDA